MIVSGQGVSVVQPADAADFEAWIRPHWDPMLRLATRLAGRDGAEDVVQDAVGSAWRKRAQFDAARGTPQSWLLTIVADQSAKHRRRRRDTTELDDYPVVDASTADPDLARAVAGLAVRQRVAVELYYYLGLPISEAAAVMGCAEGTVKGDPRGRADPAPSGTGGPRVTEDEMDRRLARAAAAWNESPDLPTVSLTAAVQRVAAEPTAGRDGVPQRWRRGLGGRRWRGVPIGNVAVIVGVLVLLAALVIPFALTRGSGGTDSGQRATTGPAATATPSGVAHTPAVTPSALVCPGAYAGSTFPAKTTIRTVMTAWCRNGPRCPRSCAPTGRLAARRLGWRFR